MLFLEETTYEGITSKVVPILYNQRQVVVKNKRSLHLSFSSKHINQYKQHYINPYKMMMFKQHHHHRNTRTKLSTACCLISLYASLLLPLISNFATGQLDLSNPGASSIGSDQINNQPILTPQEILVQPNAQVRIPCKLPQLISSDKRSFYWMFQRTSVGAPKIVCSETKCLSEAKNSGVQLYTDSETGTYDLIINNATYELHDGLYYCDYDDTTPGSKQMISREYRLTVLSKYSNIYFLFYFKLFILVLHLSLKLGRLLVIEFSLPQYFVLF